jgi:hypothetical protein
MAIYADFGARVSLFPQWEGSMKYLCQSSIVGTFGTFAHSRQLAASLSALTAPCLKQGLTEACATALGSFTA